MGAIDRVATIYKQMHISLTKVFDREAYVDELFELYYDELRTKLGVDKLTPKEKQTAASNAERDARFISANWLINYHTARVTMLAAAYQVEADYARNYAPNHVADHKSQD